MPRSTPTSRTTKLNYTTLHYSTKQAAVAKINSNIKNTAFELKRLIGRRWDDADLQVPDRDTGREHILVREDIHDAADADPQVPDRDTFSRGLGFSNPKP